uniref:Uncharacterized protein n=1 Tax=Oryza punctata TaxID=4537 RepID=A0A0E0MAN7_ORYPU
MDAATTEFSGMVISGRRLAAKLFLLPLKRILDISDADTLHDLERYSMGSNGVCGGGIAAAAASSSSISMTKVSAISLGFQALSMAILATTRREAHTKHKKKCVEPPWYGRQKEQRGHKADRAYEKEPSLLFGSKGKLGFLPIEPHKITLCQVLRILTNDNDCHQR